LDWSAVSSAMFMKQKLKDSNNDIVRFKSIRRVEFSKQNTDVFKIAYIFKLNEDNYLELLSVNINNQNRLRSTTSVLNISKPKQLYTSKLPISSQKYKDLRKLCEKKTIRIHSVREHSTSRVHQDDQVSESIKQINPHTQTIFYCCYNIVCDKQA